MNIKQLKSQSLLQEALCEALCELSDTRLRNLAITKVELSAGKESAKVFLDANSLGDMVANDALKLLKKANGAIRANLHASLDWYKVPNLRFEIDRDLAQMNRLDEIFKKIHAKENAESALDSAKSQNLGENISSLRADSQNLRGKPPCDSMLFLQQGLPRSHSLARNDNCGEFAESGLDSAPHSHSNTKKIK